MKSYINNGRDQQNNMIPYDSSAELLYIPPNPNFSYADSIAIIYTP